MTTGVPHFEFKTEARVGKSGPGDTLRLVHALQHPVFKDEELILLSTAPTQIESFFHESHFTVVAERPKTQS